MIIKQSIFINILSLTSCLAFPYRVERDIVADDGLYGDDTRVISLNASNFENIYGTNNAWFVEFYSSWCGHCQRFAPIWKDLAQDIYGWSNVVKVAAVDCANEFNHRLCREYKVSAYPTLRFFPPHALTSNKGLDVTKRSTVPELRYTLLYLLSLAQAENAGLLWPVMSPYSSANGGSIWQDVPESVKYQILIYENANSYIGREIILDLSKIPNILVRRILYETSNMDRDTIQNMTVPCLVILQRDEENLPLNPERATREAFLATVQAFLASKNISVPPDESESTVTTPDGNEDTSRYRTDVVYQVDLENALRYSLKREVTAQDQMSGESLDALKNYLKVLARYFPTTSNGKRFLEQLRDWALDQDEITGATFLNRVQELENQNDPVFQSDDEWLGCKGSDIRYRGYPCGLWTLFHTLTTNAVLQNGNAENFNSLEVLDTMVGYIKNFFGCRECSQHFQQMARESLHGNVTQPDDGIMWLWRAHNNVNKRLAGDVTEDPKHPKIQFPSPASCPTCRYSNGNWVESQVLLFLKQMYGKHNIDYTRWKGIRNTVVSSIISLEITHTGENLGSHSSTKPIPLSSAVALGGFVAFAAA